MVLHWNPGRLKLMQGFEELRRPSISDLDYLALQNESFGHCRTEIIHSKFATHLCSKG